MTYIHQNRFLKRRLAMIALLVIFPFVTQSAIAKSNNQVSPPERANQETSSNETQIASDAQAPPPPERADQETSDKGFSTWDIQGLYGSSFREPGVHGVTKRTFTLENSAGWRWGSSYFFIDYLRSDSKDFNASEFYGEWYPSVSLTKVSNTELCVPILKDILITMGINAGAKTTGAGPLALLPGITFDLKLPFFQFFSLGAYVYMDRGRFDQFGNGCNRDTYQITPSWSLPFEIGLAHFRFDGFIDYIGKHGDCAYQIVSQPTIKLDLGNFWCKPNRLFVGAEWAYWRNKYGISGLNQNATQGVVMWVF